MVDLKTLADILENEKADGRKKVKGFVKRLGDELKPVKRLLTANNDFLLHPEKQEAYRWLSENFSRLEETVSEAKCMLLTFGKILVKGENPFFYDALCYLISKHPYLSEDDLDAVFEICNTFGEGISIGDAEALPHILKLCICEKICGVFLHIFGEKETDEGAALIRQLFLTLDELYLFDGERTLSHNKTEKILENDPAGIYRMLTPASRASYRKNLMRTAKKKRISEKKLAGALIDECKKNSGRERHIGKYLCDKPQNGRTYLFVVFFLTGIFMLLLCLVSPVFVLSFFSVYSVSRLIADKFFVRFVNKPFYLPRLSLSAVPKKHGVMAVITTLLTGKEEDGKVFEKLEEMYFSNGGENVYFGLLCDLPDSDERETLEDRNIIENASEEIRRLRQKYGNVFFLFVREREYSYSEEKYIAPERKRGAVNSLCSFLCDKADAFSYGSIKPGKELCENIKYILTLDSDTNLAFDCIKELAGIMLHPQNEPVWDKEKAVVTKGYGILQPAVNPTLESSGKSFFAAVLSGHGGTDMYSAGGTDFNMSLFGRSIFCGKGMFDKNCFYELLCEKNGFEKERILSHDAPEGARLRCAFVPEVVFTDSFPSEILSYCKRQHRWIRGDLQNLTFLKSAVKTYGGSKIKNNIGAVSKFFIWENAVNAFLPVLTLVMLLVSFRFDDMIRALLVSVSLAPYVLQLVNSFSGIAKKALWQSFVGGFYSGRVYSGLWSAFLKMLFRICAVPYMAYVSFDAAVRSICRTVISHKKMLEWTTAAQNDAEKRDGLLGYVKKLLFNAACGTALFVSSPAGIVRFIGLLWLFMPVFAYHSGRTKAGKRTPLTDRERDRLLKYCGDMYSYFAENVSEKTNHLPPDNISLYPERKASRMTSPTNIGLYLLSLVCCEKMGLVDRNELLKRLCDTLSSVDSLEKYKGLLYNWYDVFRAEPMEPKYVSSVDLGNYIACLICVKEAVREMNCGTAQEKRIISLCEKLTADTDLSLMYDKDKKLFFIGGTVEKEEIVFDKNRYDMLMSEARILSFCSVALKSVGKEHLSCLSRRLVKGKGYMGLASWSGTAFEFFMPEIFMPSKEGSLLYEALCFAYSNIVKNTARDKSGSVFGISESCFGELDSSSNYKYRAFGIQKIAVNTIDERRVISPYSSFLCLPMSKKAVLSNLSKLEKMGAYGEYGFFEALDFESRTKEKNFSLVKCFMAHHIGMSIASAANMLYGSLVSDWFGKDKRIKSALVLNDEKIPYDAYAENPVRRHYKKGKSPAFVGRNEIYHKKSIVKLKRGNLSVSAKKGNITVKTKEHLALRKKLFSESLGSLEAAVSVDGLTYVFDKACTLKTDGGQIVYAKSFSGKDGAGFDGALSITVGTNTSDTLRIRMRLRRLSGEDAKTARFSVSFYPLLDLAKNGEVCSFFDSRDIVLKKYDESEVCFSRFSSGKNICCGIVHGIDKRAVIDGERVMLECKSLLQNNIFETEFALSFSESRICAETGLVRCRQDSFEKVCEQVRAEGLKGDTAPRRERPEGKSEVLGCSVDKGVTKYSYPLKTNNDGAFLLASRSFCALCTEDNLGISFKNDINRERVTRFLGVSEGFSNGERLLCGGVDLCKNSKQTTFENGTVCYYGGFGENTYCVKVCVLPDMPCKLITVSLKGHYGLSLEIEPSGSCDGVRYIGSGLVYFSDEKDENKGFVFGFCNRDGKETGAKYAFDGGISVSFDVQDCFSEYTFCIGKATRQQSFEIYNRVREQKNGLFDAAESFAKDLVYDEALIDKGIKLVLESYFAFPVNHSCTAVFACPENALGLFYTLLLMYSPYAGKREYVIKAFGQKVQTGLEKYLLCLILSEYARITNDREVAELKIGGETLYKRCLVSLFSELDTAENKQLLKLSLVYFALFCESLGDVRTSLELSERIRKLDDKRDGGIFL